jgi:hypothetical protein
MNTKKRHAIVVLGSVVGAAALSSGAALAGNCHHAPPGQAKQQSATVAAGASVSGNATARGHAKHESSVAAGASVSGKATARGHAKHESGVAAGASVSGKVTARGRIKHQSTSVAVGTSASNATGVKSSSTTGFNMHAAAGSNATKSYGNGRTAGQIAVQNGAGVSADLYGPGNSQPHKAALCSAIFFHMVDVHALKAHAGRSCVAGGTTSSSGSTGVSSAGSVSGSVSGSVHGKGVGVGAKAHTHAAGRVKSIRLSRSGGVLGAHHSVAGSVTAQATPAHAVLGTANFTG